MGVYVGWDQIWFKNKCKSEFFLMVFNSCIYSFVMHAFGPKVY